MRPSKSTTAEVKPPAPQTQSSMSAAQVAVVLPVFNQLEYTRGCVESLAPDKTAGLELIVIDNGSIDGTDAFLSSLPNAKLVRNQTNLGCAKAWNQGAQLSTR